ncbi:hypothetical protein [Aeromonas phage phiWae14]|nr:hypothetical protein [Aeromonas phage phiWae14]
MPLMTLVTGKICEGLPPDWQEQEVKTSIQIDLEKYQMSEVDVTLTRDIHNRVTSSLIVLNDGHQIRFRGNALENEAITLREIGYVV